MKENDKELYFEVFGEVKEGFQGHIEYSVQIPKEVKKIFIVFEFDNGVGKRKINEENFLALCKKGLEEFPNIKDEQILKLAKSRKTEINLSVFQNDKCLGSAHKNLNKKEVFISINESSDGFVKFNPEEAVLKIALHVLNVLYDKTKYSLKVKGE